MATKKTMKSGEVDALLNELERKMQRLRSLYEQYFMGIERIPPKTARKEVFRLIRHCDNLYIRNTAQKFRMRSLVQRFNSYKAYWNRVEKQIEEGTYERDIRRAKRNKERQNRAEAEDDGLPILDIDLEEVGDLQEFQAELEEMDKAGAFDNYDTKKQSKLDEIRSQLEVENGQPAPSQPAPSQPSPPSSSQPAAPAPEPGSRESKLARLKARYEENTGKTDRPGSTLPTGGASMDKLRELHAAKQKALKEQEGRKVQRSGPQRKASSQRVIQRQAASRKPPTDDHSRSVYNKLLEAKRRCNESTSGLTYESVRQSMKQQRDQLKKARGARDVDFKVVIKDGRAFLKPIPK